jgi:NAD(P)-dependent dehydrogenase (short-subunit alcohol dehydrogenase family)
MLAEGTFDGKVAIVTGGGSGLGRAIALELGRLGASVAVAGRRPEPLDETVALLAGDGLAVPTDVRDP